MILIGRKPTCVLSRHMLRSRLLRTAAVRLAGRRGYHAPVRDMRFLLYEVHDFEAHHASLTPAAGEVDESAASQPCDREMVEMVIESTQVLCENELAPLLAGADSEGCTWVDKHHVKTPAGFKEAYKLWYESGWQGLMFPPQYGGQGMPASVGMIQGEMTATANYTWTMFPGLSKGAINTLLAHGSDALKDKYLPPLVSGEFTGTMCLTEPQCGSDLGQVTTKAVDNGDGTYSLSGTKIFISCGEHDMASNIIHCVLARLPDAPEGTKGISLFLVPKKSVDESGSVGEHNGVSVSRIEDKMGCHGSPTCQVEFEGATGWLIGEPNRGLNHMFTFINTSRIGTAVQGVAAAELAFQNTLWYTKERGSMRALSGTKAPSLKADPIIWHPSVRTMLLTQKAVAEGGRSMVYECAKLVDKMDICEAAGDTRGAKAIDERLAFLTPILKGFLTEVRPGPPSPCLRAHEMSAPPACPSLVLAPASCPRLANRAPHRLALTPGGQGGGRPRHPGLWRTRLHQGQ